MFENASSSLPVIYGILFPLDSSDLSIGLILGVDISALDGSAVRKLNMLL